MDVIPFEDQAQPTPRSPALRTLTERGFVNQCTNESGLDHAFQAGIVPVYIGFDATADSLHAGHLIPIMTLRNLQRRGHKPVVLVGGGTTRVGDPSFRNEARPLLSDAEIAENIAGLQRGFEQFLRFGDGPTDAVLVNNADWLDEQRYIPMLRDVGRHFSVNRMLSFDSVKSRLERQEPLSFLEFNYMILQAFDFLELHGRHGVRVQMGGADQWGNIVSGVDLVRRLRGEEVFGLTAPLLMTAAGTKMGKTASGAVWLNAERLSPYGYWQFWRNTADADVGRFLRLFTDLPMAEIETLAALTGADSNIAKKRLADEATILAHGEEAAAEAATTARRTFEDGGLADGLPTLLLSPAQIRPGVPVVDLLLRADLAGSKSEARRLIHGGGVRLDGAAVVSDQTVLTDLAFAAGASVRLSAGRKRHVLVRLA